MNDLSPQPPSPAEPVAVVGIGCRLPGGADSPDALWRLLLDAVNVSGPVPEERWAPHRAQSRENAAVLSRIIDHGAFLDDIAGFDASFFGISATEARQLDPQQRMALEVAWEALEHAGIPAAGLAGTDTGVFLGVGTDDYGRRLLEDLPGVEAWTGIGSSLCGVPNRVSYTFDLRGPSVAVDTACSSSLVAVHQACAALRAGETPVALAGGVMLMAGPGLTTVLDHAGAISPDGRSKAFDAAANGYGRGEGCAVVVLKTLSDARRDGDRVVAVIRGSAVHQDGRTDGIMAPSAAAQAHLLRKAYAAAGVDPAEVDYVEAHGTGTRVGDPVEASALAEVVGAGRAAGRPCLIGSVKTNIGHCEAAAGIAGLVKTALALQHGLIPPTVTVQGPRPDIPWQASGLSVVTEPTPWPRTDRPRRAGVASYGYGGTIAHVVLEQAPDVRELPDTREPAGPRPTAHGPALPDGQAMPDGPALPDAEPGTVRGGEPPAGSGPAVRPTLFPLSSATGPGLAAQAGRLRSALGGHALADTGHTLAHRRAHLGARAAVLAATAEELDTALGALEAGEAHERVVTGECVGGPSRPVWVFSGHGAQWSGMGRELLAEEPVFAEAVDRLGPVFAEELGVTPREVLTGGDLGPVDIVQSMLFAVQIGLTAVWRRYGVEPAAVIGHSVGEIAAAVAAGSLTEEDGARLVCRRSALLRKVAGQGAMIMVDRSFEEVRDRIGTTDALCAAIAAAPSSTVVAGDVPAVDAAAGQWAALGWTVRRIDSDVAFHSPQMDLISGELAAAVAELEPREPRVPLYLTAVEDPRSGVRQDARYWAGNLRNAVRFRQAVQAAAEDGHRLFLEISAHPVVSHSVTETLGGRGDALVLPTLRRNRPQRPALLASLARLHCHGVPVDWTVLQPDGALTDLPTTAWRHERHWVEGRFTSPSPQDTLLGDEAAVHGSHLRVWQTTLDLRTRPYPRRHPVLGTEIVPAAVLLNTFLTAGRTDTLTDVHLRQPVVVPQEDTRQVQIVLDGSGLRLVSRALDAPDTAWVTHTTAALGERSGPVAPLAGPPACDVLDPDHVVDRLARLGVAGMGYPWTIEELYGGEGTLTASVSADRDTTWAAVLDAALSMASVIFPGPAVLRMPAFVGRVTRTGRAPRRAVVDVRLDTEQPSTVHVDVRGEADGADGEESVVTLRGLRYGELDGDLSDDRRTGAERFEPAWRPFPVDVTAASDRPGGTLLVVGPTELACALVPEAAARGVTVSVSRRRLEEADQVLYAPDDTEPADAAAQFVRLMAEVAALPGRKPVVWCLTRGVRECVDADALAGSPLWGLGRVAAGEHPDFWGGVVDLPAEPWSRQPVQTLFALLRLRPAEPVLSVVGEEVHTVRLVPAAPVPDGARFACRADGTYLITGGLGVLGLELAGHLAARGARRIVLLGRTPVPPRARRAAGDPRTDALGRLEAAGVTVRTVAADITDAAATRAALDALDLPPVRGVVHAAGTVHSALLHRLEEDALRDVMRPKVDGALVLHELFPPGATDFFVLFSSAGPLLGLPGQGAYAAANSFLDALAAHRRARGARETVAMAWTSWRGMGMATAAEATDLELAARGTCDIAPDHALRAFDQTAAGGSSALVAVLGLLRGHTGPRPALLAELARDEASQPAEVPDWMALEGEELSAYLLDEVRRRVAGVLGTQPDAVSLHRPLTEAGVDSLLAAAIRVALERDLGVALPATLLWNHPTVGAIAGHLGDLLTAAGAGDQEQDMAR